MSQNTAGNDLSGAKGNSAEDIYDHFPKQCAIPGYWKTIAENSDDWARAVTVSPLWTNANSELDEWKREYRREFSGILYKGGGLPNFIGKSPERIKEKILDRVNRSDDRALAVAEIFNQPIPVPRIEDLVRVRVETQYLDGVPFMARKLLEVAKRFDTAAIITPKGKLAGYFAQHLTFMLPVHFRFNGEQTSCNVVCEVQVATVLATQVWEASHNLYENSRVKLDERSEDWQWSPSDPRFLSRQLGHMIHLADGLFCTLRDKTKAG